ncbi:MAG: hypothetical protein ACR2P8_05460 [Myxococcota bacterium]
MRIPVPLLLVGSLAALACASAAPQGDLKPWDQEQVTLLAVNLASAATDARNAARRDPNVAASRDRRVLRYLDALRRVETGTIQLATALQSGQGREQTEPIATRVRGFVRDARQHGFALPQTIQTRDAIAPAEKLLEELAPYWFPQGA